MPAIPIPMAIFFGVENLRPHCVPNSHIIGNVSTMTKNGLIDCQISGAIDEVITKSRAKSDIDVPF